MKHQACPIDREAPLIRAERKQFETWMASSYPGMQLEANRESGYYTDPAVNCCWEIWLHRRADQPGEANGR